MAFTKHQFTDGLTANAKNMNENFLEIYIELENFPGPNGAIATNAVETGGVDDGQVELTHVSDWVLTTDDDETFNDTLTATAAFIKKYINGTFFEANKP